ncbi:MAG: hypothetical protein ACXW2E_02115 [Nitrososphaeraceae archaeon]
MSIVSSDLTQYINKNSTKLPTSRKVSITHQVRLVSVLDMNKNAPGDIKSVIFKVTPTISESGSVEYASIQPIHMPGGIQVYKNTSSRVFEISAHFVSRNTEDALENIKYLQTLRSWRYPFFGQSATDFKKEKFNTKIVGDRVPHTEIDKHQLKQNQIKNDKSGINLLGAPPEVLYLYGYSNSINDSRSNVPGINLNRIPVVISNLNITYNEDVDYIPIQSKPNSNTEPFPIKMDVGITLLETHSPTEFERFSLESYKRGTLVNF